jgi:hypothetical protein
MKYDTLFFYSATKLCTYNTRIKASQICIFATTAFQFYTFTKLEFGVHHFTFISPSELGLKVDIRRSFCNTD